MKGRKPKPALNVVRGEFGGAAGADVPEPKWTMPFPEDWGRATAKIAKAQWAVIGGHMLAAGTLGPENAAQIEIYCVNYARWRLAEADVAERGPIVPAPRTGVPIANPMLRIADAAAELVRKMAVDLGLPPTMRGRAEKAAVGKKRRTAADAYRMGA